MLYQLSYALGPLSRQWGGCPARGKADHSASRPHKRPPHPWRPAGQITCSVLPMGMPSVPKPPKKNESKCPMYATIGSGASTRRP